MLGCESREVVTAEVLQRAEHVPCSRGDASFGS